MQNGGERELDSGQTERECVIGRASVKEGVASIQHSTFKHKHITEIQSDKQDE